MAEIDGTTELTLGLPMTIGFRSFVALTDVPVVGCYRHNDSFQILPPPPHALRPPARLGYYPVILELAVPLVEQGQQTELGHEIDAQFVNIQIAQERLKHLLLLLTGITNHRFFVPSSKQGWFISLGVFGSEVHSFVPQWGQEAYFLDEHEYKIDGFSPLPVEQISQSDSSTYFNRYGRPTDQVLEFPDQISRLLNSADSLLPDAQRALLSACSLLDQGLALWHAHPSLSFASCVSALEALIAFDHREQATETCSTCGQDRYRVMKKFQEFFARYGSPSPEFRKCATKVYRYRSKILHRGELFLGEVIQPKFGSFDGYDDRQLHRNLIRTVRICIVNWVALQRQAQPGGQPDAAP